MQSDLNWQSLRMLNASRTGAFEELCSQLARYEYAKEDGSFVRKGTPDAGVECYWTLAGGGEHAWQAKFFPETLGDSQWRQLNASARTAIARHPDLRKYTVCMPIDLPDSRAPGKSTARRRWEDHVARWTAYAQERGMDVEFEFWGSSELLDRLSGLKHRGRRFFWFGGRYLSDETFGRRLEEAIESAGERYSPQIHVDVELACLFDGLARTPAFAGEVQSLAQGLASQTDRLARFADDPAAPPALAATVETCRTIESTLASADLDGVEVIGWDLVQSKATGALIQIEDTVDALESTGHTNSRARGAVLRGADAYRGPSFEEECTAALSWTRRRVEEIRAYATSDVARLSEHPALLLVGEAGVGKTHFLCDMAQRHLGGGTPVVLAFGECFTPGDPWPQVARSLGLPGDLDRDSLLGALEAAAQAWGRRFLLVIDAINEGDGRRLWATHLPAILAHIRRSPWVGIVLSVRTDFEGSCVSPTLHEHLVRVVHQGFAGVEFEATQRFFEHYEITAPSMPLLLPEYRNPLFLKVLCESLQARGLHCIPAGLSGITQVLRFWMDAIDSKLAREDAMDLDPKGRIVRKAVEAVADAMAESRQTRLPREKVRAIVDAIMPGPGYTKSLFRHLLSSGVLRELPGPRSADGPSEEVSFTYNRFSDHLLADRLLCRLETQAGPDVYLRRGGPLERTLADGSFAHQPGLLTALAVQLPERAGVELPDVAPSGLDSQLIGEALVQSVIWRRRDAFSVRTEECISAHVLPHADLFEALMRAALCVSADPTHPYNAACLHEYLRKYDMPRRDASWSVFLHHEHQAGGEVDRLIEWAWHSQQVDALDDEAAWLFGLALGWMLATPNRFVRDHATKALVRLMEDRPDTMCDIVCAFADVDDPYVLERVLAAAYGCAMRTRDVEGLKRLAGQVFRVYFDPGRPPVHVLSRDYARGVVEAALVKGVRLDVDRGKLTPPYGSEWPKSIPKEAGLRRLVGLDGATSSLCDAPGHIWHSVMSWGDFSRYVIGTNAGTSPWYRTRRRGSAGPRSLSRQRRTLDPSLVQRWTLKRVMELGWSDRLFGEFDDCLERFGNPGRAATKAERMGKKYQWIAYHECLARVADNFQWAGDGDDYVGPWQLSRRDIDPSCLLRGGDADAGWEPTTACWWSPVPCTYWGAGISPAQWVSDTKKLPDPKAMLRVVDDGGARWYVLNSSACWEEPTPAGCGDGSGRRRSITYWVDSYLVDEHHLDAVQKWASSETGVTHLRTGAQHLHQVYLGEYPWAPAYRDTEGTYAYAGVVDVLLTSPPETAARCVPTTVRYMQEAGEHDCSIERTVRLCLPVPTLVSGMRLRWMGREGEWMDAQGRRAVMQDPSAVSRGPSALLVRCDALTDFLEREGLGLLWVVTGRKTVLGGAATRTPASWPGELSIRGAYRETAAAIEGALHTEYQGPAETQ